VAVLRIGLRDRPAWPAHITGTERRTQKSGTTQHDVEAFEVNAVGGSDTLVVNDISGTDLAGTVTDLAANVVVNANQGDDVAVPAGQTGTTDLTGLPAKITVTGAERAGVAVHACRHGRRKDRAGSRIPDGDPAAGPVVALLVSGCIPAPSQRLPPGRGCRVRQIGCCGRPSC
jgi:hypothetical protein